MSDKETYQQLLNASKETGLPVKKILDMFSILVGSDPIENNELLKRLGVSRNVLNQVKERLVKYFNPASTLTSLSEAGMKDIKGIGEQESPEETLIKLDDQELEELKKILDKHKSKHPSPERKFDQFTATTETVAKRAALMNFMGDVRGKRILFLGDDDFTSLAVSSFGSAENIQVLDIDKRILDPIKTISEEEKLEIITTRSDFREELPHECRRKFDVVFTDPPYTSDGVALFLSRAIDSLDLQNQAARIYFCYGNSDRAKERFLPIYETIYRSGLMIRWIFDKFNRYDGAESIGSASSLFVCDVTPKTKALISGSFNGEIYRAN